MVQRVSISTVTVRILVEYLKRAMCYHTQAAAMLTGLNSKLHVAVEMSCNPVWFGATKHGVRRWFPQRCRSHARTLARMLAASLGFPKGTSTQVLGPQESLTT